MSNFFPTAAKNSQANAQTNIPAFLWFMTSPGEGQSSHVMIADPLCPHNFKKAIIESDFHWDLQKCIFFSWLNTLNAVLNMQKNLVLSTVKIVKSPPPP